MPMSFSQLHDVKNRIVRDLAAQQAAQANHEAGFDAVDANLLAMQTAYAGWAGEVDAYLTANPADAAAQALKAQRDALVAEFQTLRDRAQAASAAIAAL